MLAATLHNIFRVLLNVFKNKQTAFPEDEVSYPIWELVRDVFRPISGGLDVDISSHPPLFFSLVSTLK